MLVLKGVVGLRSHCETTAIPAVTAAQMATIDRLMADRFGVQPVQLMEIAGMAVARFARDLLPEAITTGRRVIVLAGTGGNGGDALVVARLLAGWGADVTVLLAKAPGEYRGLAAAHLATLGQLGVPSLLPDSGVEFPAGDLLIDGLLGFSTTRPPGGTVARLIRLANTSSMPKLAIDVPSGLNATTGVAYDPCLRAGSTLTLALPKTGLLAPAAQPWVGALTVADIGIPPVAYAHIGVVTPPALFAAAQFLPLTPGAHQ